ncbi:MAG: response regulator transcription factor [Syntrophobacteria bacterium]|jgi:DNA-binding response OmpR family regulator
MAPFSLLKNRSLTVLIVEDDAELREILQAEFELEGLTALTATNGSEAVIAARELKPDLILMDLMMPVMDGIEATKIVKGSEETRHIPIIMLTAAGNKEDIVAGLEAGAIDYITKPFFMPELKSRLRSVLQHKIMYDELKRIQDTLIRKERLQTVKDLTEAFQGSINGPLTVILGKIHLLKKKHSNIPDDDLETLEKAAQKIKEIVNHLGIMEWIYPVPLLNDTDLVDLPFLN